MKKILLFLLIPLLFTYCNTPKYNLKWKITNNKKIVYLIYAKTTKTKSNISTSDTLIDIIKSAQISSNDTTKIDFKVDEFYKKFIESENSHVAFSILKPHENYIMLEHSLYKKKLRPKKNPTNIQEGNNKTKIYRAKIMNNGDIEAVPKTVYGESPMNCLFKIPKLPVSIDESWTLDFKVIMPKDNLDKIKITDKITLVDVVQQGNDKIATIDYNVNYKVNYGDDKEKLLISLAAKAVFNINKGKWEYFDGVIIYSKNESTEMKQVITFNLVEITEYEYQQFLLKNKETYKVSNEINEKKVITKIKNENDSVSIINEHDFNTNKKTESASNSNCPMIYSVQVLASDKSISLDSKKFRGIKYKVEERIVPGKTKYKYKYIIGSECSKEKAIVIREKVKNDGFKGAFIVKRNNTNY